MKYLTRRDDQFVESVVDDRRRGAVIADLTYRRDTWFAGVLFLLVVMSFLVLYAGSDKVGVGLPFVAAVSWGAMVKLDLELRLLKVIARLRKEERQPLP
jgi:hypothetical protein